MGKKGVEPLPRKRHNPKSCASASSATPPRLLGHYSPARPSAASPNQVREWEVFMDKPCHATTHLYPCDHLMSICLGTSSKSRDRMVVIIICANWNNA